MEKSGKFRLTSLERNWILYDVGNSAFVLMVATLIPIFFNALAAARRPEFGGVSGLLGLCQLGCDRHHGCFEPHFGDSG